VSARGQGHVSYFCIVDLENFATASRRYTGDIHNLSVVGLFMTPVTYAGFYAETCQSKGGSGQGIKNQRQRAAAKKAGRNV